MHIFSRIIGEMQIGYYKRPILLTWHSSIDCLRREENTLNMKFVKTVRVGNPYFESWHMH